VSALLLSAVGGTRGETSVALSADHLLAVVLAGESLERGLDDTTSETEDQVEGRLLLYQLVLVHNLPHIDQARFLRLLRRFRTSNNSARAAAESRSPHPT
jgi:hypothetical protein